VIVSRTSVTLWHVADRRVSRGFMLPSEEMDAMKAQMTAVLVRDAEGYFDDPKENEALQTTVHIACEFFMFLQVNEVPEFSKADYMADTIRSGMDWFYPMAWTGSVLTGLKLQRGFGPRLPGTYSEMRSSYDTVFRQLLESTHSIKALGLLLSLVQMMLLFMVVYFPAFLSFSIEAGSE
jgi:hypothetical protein